MFVISNVEENYYMYYTIYLFLKYFMHINLSRIYGKADTCLVYCSFPAGTKVKPLS